MFTLHVALSLLLTVSAVSAKHSNTEQLTKPALHEGFGYLKEDLAKILPFTTYTLDAWNHGTIPELCKDIVTGGADNHKTYFDPHDFQIWNVQYSDCGDPWVFCHHKDSNLTIDSLAGQFGQMPIQMRQWVRHVIDVPDTYSHAFEHEGALMFYGPHENMLTTIIHETGHSLDLNGAYSVKPLSTSDKWWDAYDKDSYVPDDYSTNNAMEDVAQNTVIAVFNENYFPKGYPGIDSQWDEIANQFITLVEEGYDQGIGGSLFSPGQSRDCVKQLKASAPVSMDGNSTTKRSMKRRSNGSTSGCTLTY